MSPGSVTQLGRLRKSGESFCNNIFIAWVSNAVSILRQQAKDVCLFVKWSVWACRLVASTSILFWDVWKSWSMWKFSKARQWVAQGSTLVRWHCKCRTQFMCSWITDLPQNPVVWLYMSLVQVCIGREWVFGLQQKAYSLQLRHQYTAISGAVISIWEATQHIADELDYTQGHRERKGFKHGRTAA